MPVRPNTRRSPVQRLAARQKNGQLNVLVADSEQRVRQAYQDARASIALLISQFAAEYGRELARLEALRDEDDDRPVRVPLTWLALSGWGKRLQHAMAQASHHAAEQSRVAITHGVQAAHTLGRENARQLMIEAMRPATDRGMKWTPR